MGNRLRQERLRLRLTLQRESAELHAFDPSVRLTFQTLHQLETGRKPWPAARRLLARFFDVSEAELFGPETDR
jgi:transcriptional regulator with XRE-family HTH domain